MGAADMADLLADSSDGAGDDQADAGSKTLEREQEMSVNANARDLLDQSTHALRPARGRRLWDLRVVRHHDPGCAPARVPAGHPVHRLQAGRGAPLT